jgi:hypothetical protein
MTFNYGCDLVNNALMRQPSDALVSVNFQINSDFNALSSQF